MRKSGSFARLAAATAFAAISTLASVGAAEAHVKWFCAFSVAGQPEALRNVLCQDFELLTGVAIVALLWGAVVDRCFIGQRMNRALDRLFAMTGLKGDTMVRSGVGLLMVSAWTLGGVILTPELATTNPMIPWLQLAIGFCLIHRQTLVYAASGIVILFGIAVHDYGAFHLADYPIFLGIAAYLAAIGLGRDIFGMRPIDVLRWSAAITLMWASVEKWAYPQWTYPLFVSHPEMAMGFSPTFFMKSAGTVEFALAFALVLTPFSRRCAAIILAAMFISAIVGFGKLDAIGHAGIIGVLFAVILDDAQRKASLKEVALMPLGFCGALAAFIGLYYVSHSVLYGTTIV